MNSVKRSSDTVFKVLYTFLPYSNCKEDVLSHQILRPTFATDYF
ncbi:MAG: hypothetical protein JWQ09_2703 [Segetibacter sp.]|nr:hypothetical protein [Segetibacter sp.]